MKEKQFLRWIAIRALILTAVYLAVNAALSLSGDKSLYMELPVTRTFEEVAFEMDVPDIVSITDAGQKDGNLSVKMESVAMEKGLHDVNIMVLDRDTQEELDLVWVRVAGNGLIVDLETGNFSRYREREVCMVLLSFGFAILLWAGYAKARRELRYSYHLIFCLGLGLWTTMTACVLAAGYLRGDDMLSVYASLTRMPMLFGMLTFPLICVFAILLSISNISLIRHEGFRFRNTLGILLSLSMAFGYAILWFAYDLMPSGSERQMDIFMTVMNTLFCVYAILECFLLGAVVCGTQAARNKPAYDKDYIVILGCMIRKDGTLYPQIRGRVDKAISFYREQLAATGKQAVFVPSGGKGSNEPLAEAEAMRNYLLSQGFTGEQIIAEDRSRNTRENMQFCSEIVGEEAKVAFATTNYHVFRSGIISRQVGFTADGMGSHTKWYYWPNAYVRELIGMLSYKWRSLVLQLIPVALFFAVLQFTF